MRIKTSTQIILKFQIFTVSILFLILFVLNAFYFNIALSWYKKKWNDILNSFQSCNMSSCQHAQDMKVQKMLLAKSQWINRNFLNNNCFEYLWDNICLKDNFFLNFYKIEDIYFFVYDNQLIFNVTNFIEFQLHLIKVSLYVLIFYAILSYFVWYLFLQKVYKKIFKAAKELESNNYINLKEYKLADKDELKILFETINRQIDSISSFNKYLSHELKTPLMNMSSTLDLLYEKYNDEKLNKIKHQIFYIKDIIDTLNKLILIENKKIDLKMEDVNICNIAKDFNYKINIDCEKETIKTNKELIQIVIKNLLDNANKYTISSINLKITDNYLMISNKTNKQLDIDKLTQKFYKQSENGLWLGLYLVDNITKILNYKLSIKQEWEDFIVKVEF